MPRKKKEAGFSTIRRRPQKADDAAIEGYANTPSNKDGDGKGLEIHLDPREFADRGPFLDRLMTVLQFVQKWSGQAMIVLYMILSLYYIYWILTLDHNYIKHTQNGLAEIASNTWVSREASLEPYMQSRRPVLLTNVPLHEMGFKVLQRWTPEYMAEHVPTFYNIYNGSKHRFEHFTDDLDYNELRERVLKLTGEHWTPPYTMIKAMSGSAFISAVQDASNPYSLYYSGSVSALGSQTLLDDLGDARAFFTPENTRFGVEHLRVDTDANDPVITAWVGAPKVTAAMHYDAVHNVFVQVFGRKRFLLLPPEATDACYMRSSLHPSAHKCQVQLRNATRSEFPLYSHMIDRADASLRPSEITLEPGDVLYLPPYWLHEVEARGGVSLSMSIWTRPPEVGVFGDLLDQPFPFEDDDDDDTRRASLIMFLQYVMMLVDTPVGSTEDVLLNLIQTRYVVSARTTPAMTLNACRLRGGRSPDEELTMPQYLRKRATVFAKELQSLPAPIRLTKTHDFIEAVVNWRLGTHNVLPFLKAFHMCIS